MLLWNACHQLNSSTFFVFSFLFLFPASQPLQNYWTLLESQGKPIQVLGVYMVQALVLCVLHLLLSTVLLPRALALWDVSTASVTFLWSLSNLCLLHVLHCWVSSVLAPECAVSCVYCTVCVSKCHV